MQKQKICIIGGGLTGLITAITLSKLNLKVDLITGDSNQNVKSNRTIAISPNNYAFLKKLNIFEFLQKDFWLCSKMQLYAENEKSSFSKIFEFSADKKRKNQVLYMVENSKIQRLMIKNIKKNKSIRIKTEKIISSIFSSGLLKGVKFNNRKFKYDLIIICTGNNSNLIKNIFKEKAYESFYDETSITTTLKHNSINNNTVRQFFFKNQILALLPISNTKTSIVWTVKKSLLNRYKKKSFLKEKIKFYTKDYFRKINFSTNIEYKNLNFLIRNKYFKNRILLFGDALHVVHPFVGQGFNMVLRDLIRLEKILKKKITLGLDIGSSDILSEFSNATKPSNFVYSMGIDFLKSCFSYQNNSFKKIRNIFLSKLNKSDSLKNIFFNIADKGVRF